MLKSNDPTPPCGAMHDDGATSCVLPPDHLDVEPEGFHASGPCDVERKQWRKIDLLHRPGAREAYGMRINDRVTWTPAKGP